MGFDVKNWNNPVNLDYNDLNRIEHGIKDAHDILEIHNEEISNLQHKQLSITEDMKLVIEKAPDILTTLNRLNSLLNNDISAQSLTQQEKEQIYKNLGLNNFINYNSIIVNGKKFNSGDIINIKFPEIDYKLNADSSNAISNKTVTTALKELENKLSNISPGTNTEIDYSAIQQYLKNKTTVVIRRWI